MSLWQSPIEDSSIVYEASGDQASPYAEYAIEFPDSVISKLGRVDDIWLRYFGPSTCSALEVHVYNVETSDWVPVELRPGGGACTGWPTTSWWLLGTFTHEPFGRFVDERTPLTLRGNLWSPRARLLRYVDDFEFVTVTTDFSRSSMGHDGEYTWVAVGQEGADSVIIYNPDGTRNRAFARTGGTIGGMAWSGDRFWVVQVANPPTIGLLDGTGEVSSTFTVPVDYWDTIRGGIAYADSLLWLPRNDGQYPHPPVMKMIALDPVASIESGEGVIVGEFAAPATFRGMQGLTSRDGELLVTTGDQLYPRFYELTLDGTIIEDRQLEITAGPIAWDGESLWMLHSGPARMLGRGTMLSRFALD